MLVFFQGRSGGQTDYEVEREHLKKRRVLGSAKVVQEFGRVRRKKGGRRAVELLN